MACLRCLILLVFVVAGSPSENHCMPSMLDFNGICRVPEHLVILLVFIGCLILMVFVEAGSTSGGHGLRWMIDFAGICRSRKSFEKSLFAFDA